MKTYHCGLVLILASSLPGQVPAEPANKAADEPITMSAFVANAQRDQGYTSLYTTGGTRISLEIKDAPISVVVLNQQFRDDIGAQDLQQLTRLVAGVTPVANPGSNQVS